MTPSEQSAELKRFNELAAKATPGPWEDDETGSIFGDLDFDYDGDNPFVADTRADRVHNRSDEERANAALIVSVPDLLTLANAQAKEIKELVACLRDVVDKMNPRYDFLRIASINALLERIGHE